MQASGAGKAQGGDQVDEDIAAAAAEEDNSEESEESPEEERKRSEEARQRYVKRRARASKLYRAYLRAQFEGDQLEAHHVLIKLAQRYPTTRHGRKAQRLLLLDGR